MADGAPNAPNSNLRPTVAASQDTENQAPAAEATGEAESSANPPDELSARADTTSATQTQAQPSIEGKRPTQAGPPLEDEQQRQARDIAQVVKTARDPPEPQAAAPP